MPWPQSLLHSAREEDSSGGLEMKTALSFLAMLVALTLVGVAPASSQQIPPPPGSKQGPPPCEHGAAPSAFGECARAWGESHRGGPATELIQEDEDEDEFPLL